MICYMVACYFGKRRIVDDFYTQDHHYYLNHHLASLTKLETTLISQIVFTINDETSRIINIPNSINGIPVDVIVGPNVGLSYGAWERARQRYDQEFFMMMEDDYVPVLDNFEIPFMEKMNEDVGYVCELFMNGHAAMPHGVVRSSVLKHVNGFKYAPNAEYGANEALGQVKFSHDVMDAGYKIVDIADEYRVPYVDAHRGMLYYGNPDGKDLIMPIHLMRESGDIYSEWANMSFR
jgi:hypothetical protein